MFSILFVSNPNPVKTTMVAQRVTFVAQTKKHFAQRKKAFLIKIQMIMDPNEAMYDEIQFICVKFKQIHVPCTVCTVVQRNLCAKTQRVCQISLRTMKHFIVLVYSSDHHKVVICEFP